MRAWWRIVLGGAVGTALMAFSPVWWSDDVVRAKAYPYLWYWVGKDRHLNYAATFFILGFAILVIAQIFEKKRMATEMKGVVTDREFINQHSQVVDAAIKAVAAMDGMSAEELTRARKQILRGICLVVQQYYDKSPRLEINACYMLAYPAANVPNGIDARLKFTVRDRELRTYQYVLDLILWAVDQIDLPQQLALPVEDASDPEKKFSLLPGAPAAFALNKVCEVADTHSLDEYFENEGRYVDRLVIRQLVDFLKVQGYRSFASFPLGYKDCKKGVLNVQSARPFIFGRESQHEMMVTQLLQPLRTALAILI
jgi:hypothetical protein